MPGQGWNLALAAPLRSHGDLVAVSGRCVHNFDGRQNGGEPAGNCKGSGLRWDLLPEHNRTRAEASAWVHVRDVAVRSPLMLRAAYSQRLRLLNEIDFFLGGDDHDFCKSPPPLSLR